MFIIEPNFIEVCNVTCDEFIKYQKEAEDAFYKDNYKAAFNLRYLALYSLLYEFIKEEHIKDFTEEDSEHKFKQYTLPELYNTFLDIVNTKKDYTLRLDNSIYKSISLLNSLCYSCDHLSSKDSIQYYSDGIKHITKIVRQMEQFYGVKRTRYII